MEYHGIDMIGKYYCQSKDKDVEPFEERRLIYDPNDEEMYFGSSSQWIGLESATNSAVPAGSIILFESNTAINGYTLLTTDDDSVVYITKGSVAGGETGGTAKSGGTWTYGHNHTYSDSTGSHNHQWYNLSGNIGYSWESDGTTQKNTNPSSDSNFGILSEAEDDEALVSSFWTNNNTVSISGTTDADAGTLASGTWRPKGRNFTRQQRN